MDALNFKHLTSKVCFTVTTGLGVYNKIDAVSKCSVDKHRILIVLTVTNTQN